MGPPRKIGKICAIFGFFRPTQKMGREGPKWAREVFFLANPDLADILGRTDFDFENFYFFDFLGSQISGLGPAWAHPLGPGVGPPTWARCGPTHLGPAWAHPLGPGLGPPTWAQLGPTHLDFQTPPPDEFSNPHPGPSQRTQG